MSVGDTSDLLFEEYTIETPENVSFGYPVAGIGNRFIAALLDASLLGFTLLLLNILIVSLLGLAGELDGEVAAGFDAEVGWIGGLVIALYALLNFTLIWGYFFLFELLWQGQTPGKRAAQIRVVRMNGSPPGFLEVATRNLVRVVDFLPVGYGVGLITMFFNRHARRLGDFAAGTMVVKDRGEIALSSLGMGKAMLHGEHAAGAANLAGESAPPTAQRVPYISQLTAADYELIQEVLARHDQGQADASLLRRTAQVIAAKVEETLPDADWRTHRRFLVEVAEAYRHAAR